MVLIKQRFGKDFIQAADEFCKRVAIYSESFIKALVRIGDEVDMIIGFDSGFAAETILDIINRNKKVKIVAQNLLTLYGLEGLKVLFARYFPERQYHKEKLHHVYTLINNYREEYIQGINRDKLYIGHSDPKHRIFCKEVKGFKGQNKWKRIRSNPKLR